MSNTHIRIKQFQKSTIYVACQFVLNRKLLSNGEWETSCPWSTLPLLLLAGWPEQSQAPRSPWKLHTEDGRASSSWVLNVCVEEGHLATRKAPVNSHLSKKYIYCGWPSKLWVCLLQLLACWAICIRSCEEGQKAITTSIKTGYPLHW